MIRHLVMWRVRARNAEELRAACQLVKTAFESLRGHIPGMVHLEVGIDQSCDAYACDVVLVSDFETADALAAYAIHPEHRKVRDDLGDMRTHRYRVDYVVDPG
jgi:hypothetical protein